jgi:hypothetical protein
MDAPTGIDLPEPAYAGESDEGIRALLNMTPNEERDDVGVKS